MLEICTSTVAWISVVIIQAFLHFFVLGARRDRIQKETEAALLEDNLSFTSNEVSFGSDLDMMNIPETPTGDPSFSSTICVSPDRQDGNRLNAFGKIPLVSIQRRTSIDSNGIDATKKIPTHMTQTGTEMLKSCSFKNVVEQQIRSMPQ